MILTINLLVGYIEKSPLGYLKREREKHRAKGCTERERERW